MRRPRQPAGGDGVDVRVDGEPVRRPFTPVRELELTDGRLEVVVDTGLTIFTYTADPGTRSAERLSLLGSLAATSAV